MLRRYDRRLTSALAENVATTINIMLHANHAASQLSDSRRKSSGAVPNDDNIDVCDDGRQSIESFAKRAH